MTARELNRATLARQGLIEPITAQSPSIAVRRLGSLQAQHPEWPPVALAARAATGRVADLASALQRRSVVRSSLMRITIHVVSADDLWPMFAVVQPLRLNQWRLLTRADPFDSSLGRTMMSAHAAAIDALRQRPRSSLEIDRLMAAEVGTRRPAQSTTVPRAFWRHFAACVPLVHVPHDGEGYGRSQYALAEEWLAASMPELEPGEAHTRVARRYLASFGPASADDLAAYVGRGKGGVGPWRRAIASLADELVELRDEAGRALYDLEMAPRPAADTPVSPRLLARWDSLLLSHAPRHRDRVIAEVHRPAVFSKNADVLPTVLIDGMVAGTWDLTRAGGAARVTLRPFSRLTQADRDALEAEAARLLAIIEPRAATREVVMAGARPTAR